MPAFAVRAPVEAPRKAVIGSTLPNIILFERHMPLAYPPPMSIIITGKIASGKTTLARCLAEELGCVTVSFGDYVRAKSRESGKSLDRPTLQDTYISLIESLGHEGFAASVLAAAGVNTPRTTPLILEGIRNIEIIDALRTELGAEGFVWIHLAPDDGERRSRAKGKGITDKSLKCADLHKSEDDSITGLFERHADLVITHGDAREVCKLALRFIFTRL